MAQSSPAQVALRVLEEALDANLNEQEELLFPAVQNCEEAADAGQPLPEYALSVLRDLIPKMKQDQWHFVALLKKVREQAGNDGPTELRDLESDLRVHIQLEDTILFPRALRLTS